MKGATGFDGVGCVEQLPKLSFSWLLEPARSVKFASGLAGLSEYQRLGQESYLWGSWRLEYTGVGQ